MKQLQQLAYKGILLGLGMLAIEANAQKQTKTYNESFKVAEDAVLDINTSYADIQFETWDKNEVVVEATIELEGATPEEAQEYFENSGIKILGNSQTIEIRTASRSLWGDIALANTVFEVPEIANIAPLFQDIAIPDMPALPEMPPVPPIPNIDFDYEAFEKDGEAYLKKWKKEFNKRFDKKYQKKMEEWGKQFKEQAEEQRQRIEKQRKEREEQREEQRQLVEKQRMEMKEQREEMQQQHKEAREQAEVLRLKAQEMARDIRRNVIINGDAPTIFYKSSDGDSKKFKVKKIIKVKMPKSTTLKMNVRHGEVKLAKNTRNMNATLSHTRLLAATIDGDKTNITASYSPVNVELWNYGSLNTSFSEEVVLNTVNQINLNTRSSHVVVDNLLKSMLGKNSLGSLHIKAIDTDFSDVDISVKNGELSCVVPTTPFTMYVNNTFSDFTYPDDLNVSSKKNNQQLVYTGYYQNKNANKTIRLHSNYSSIILK
ncbi:MAG: hypothetical protein HKN52_11645 [Eudoraea sp.]|nr:hypothetical protein [Eudoraea sp.]